MSKRRTEESPKRPAPAAVRTTGARRTSRRASSFAPRDPLLDDARGRDEDLEASAPPLSGKVHPPHEMGFVVPATDDEMIAHPHHPNETAVAAFQVNPDAADAARDLAGDLGAQFLEGVTFGEDVSERAIEDAEANDAELPFLLEQEGSDEVVIDEPEPRGEPGPFARRKRSRAARA